MLLVLEFPSEGKSFHNRTDETLKEEITGTRKRGRRKRGHQCAFIPRLGGVCRYVCLCVYDERTEAGFSQD